MGHKLERIFFGILLIGNFFIISLFSGDLLDFFYRILDQKVSTFEQLATMNPTIYITQRIAVYNDEIHKMLRFVHATAMNIRIRIDLNVCFLGRKSHQRSNMTAFN